MPSVSPLAVEGGTASLWHLLEMLLHFLLSKANLKTSTDVLSILSQWLKFMEST